MRYTTGIVVGAFFAVTITIAVFYAIGQPTWAGIALAVLAVAAVVLMVVRVFRRPAPVSEPVVQAGQVQSDFLMGVTYSGPRVVAPPVQQATELVVDLPQSFQDPAAATESATASRRSPSPRR
ncbi:MAG TPA: hypothetical protein VNQ52_04835 [Microbacteriaceae bacterium]|nr:hypothetical protein [Microbacteriaceae bacterium]